MDLEGPCYIHLTMEPYQTYKSIIPSLYKFWCLILQRFYIFSQHINLIYNRCIQKENKKTSNNISRCIHVIIISQSFGEESNPQQPYYKYGVLPLNYQSKDSPVKIRTSTKGTKNLCATVTPPENIKNIIPQL